MAQDADGDIERERFLEFLRQAERRPDPIAFWWRDDDAETETPALERLLGLARRHELPLALAVVPKGATNALAKRLLREPNISVLQHGWSHRNHASPGARKIELGDDRPLDAVLGDLRQGFERLTALVPEKFQPVLVPPWNRIADSVGEARREIELVGLSTFGPASWLHQVNTHVDIFEWKPERRPLSRAEAYACVALELERRLAGDREPIGILTHHLVHEEASWDFLDGLFELTARHAGVAWPTIGELFGL